MGNKVRWRDAHGTRHAHFRGKILTERVYRTEAKRIQVWFDETGTLRLKN